MLEISEINGSSPGNLKFHTPNDTLDTLDLQFHAEVTRANVAALAELAELP